MSSAAKIMTARLRSQAHSQSFTQTFQAKKQVEASAATKRALQKVDELVNLCRMHRRTFDPSLRQKALNLYGTLPLPLSTDDDPHFIAATKTLKAAAHLSMGAHPLTHSLLHHCSRHTFLMDGKAAVELVSALRKLNEAQCAKTAEVLLPRLVELTSDTTVVEAAEVLENLHFLSIHQWCDLSALYGAYEQLMVDTAPSFTSPLELHRILRGVLCLPPDQARNVIKAMTPTLIRRLCEGRQHSQALSDPAAASATVSSTERDELRGLVSSSIRLHRTLCQVLLHCQGELSQLTQRHAIRQLLNELVRNVMFHTTPGRVRDSSSSSNDSSTGSTTSVVMVQYDLCSICQLLSQFAYRDVEHLQLMAGRYLVSSADLPDLSTRVSPPEQALQNLRQLVTMVEAWGTFRVPLPSSRTVVNGSAEASPMEVILSEEAPLIVRRCIPAGNFATRLSTITLVSRLWRATTQLVRCAADAKHYEAARALAETAAWSWSGPDSVLTRYVKSATCHQDAPRTARLLSRLTALCGAATAAAAAQGTSTPDASDKAEWKMARAALEGLLAGLLRYYEGGRGPGQEGYDVEVMLDLNVVAEVLAPLGAAQGDGAEWMWDAGHWEKFASLRRQLSGEVV